MATIDSNIALGVRPVQIEYPRQDSPLNQMAKLAEFQYANQRNAMTRMQMEALQKEEAATNALNAAYQAAYNPQTGSIDMNALRTSIAGGGYGAKLPAIEKSLSELETQKLTRQKLEGEVKKQPLDLQESQAKVVDSKLKQSKQLLATINPNDPTAAQQYISWHEANHKDPVLGPFLAKLGVDQNQAKANIQSAIATPEGLKDAISRSMMGTDEVLKAVEPKTELGKLIAERDKLPPGDPRRKAYDAAINKSTTHTPGTNVKVELSTEKKYGEKFAGNIADSDIKLKEAAETAPDLASNANRISNILKTGKVFTGTGANIKLELAKALKVAGNTDNEAIANTELLISSLARNTLNNIKSSGLGGGQGFTDKDREFLEKASSGNITFDNRTLQMLSDLAHKSATASADRWNKRVKQIPASALEGTGVTTEPISVPSREGAAPKPSATRARADAILSGSEK
jgi:hypothetical protein